MAYDDFGDIDEVGEPGESGTGGGDPGDPYGGDEHEAAGGVPGQPLGYDKHGNYTGTMRGESWSQQGNDNIFSGITDTLGSVFGKDKDKKDRDLSEPTIKSLQSKISQERVKGYQQDVEDRLGKEGNVVRDAMDPASWQDVAMSLDTKGTYSVNEADIAGAAVGIATMFSPIPGLGKLTSMYAKSQQEKGGLFGGTQYNQLYGNLNFGIRANPTNQNVAMADFRNDPAYGGSGGDIDPYKIPQLPRRPRTYTEPSDNKTGLAISKGPTRAQLRGWRGQGRA
jgi:hypothetical protein|tara:strand:+ start:602 stop:1444 length:843 start_codon:yes stop_codon:yes gene_type:complete